MKMNGARMVCEALIAEGVKCVFGYPGGAIMNVYDEIYKQEKFEHILTRHEQAAVHAADGYARAQERRVGGCQIGLDQRLGPGAFYQNCLG